MDLLQKPAGLLALKKVPYVREYNKDFRLADFRHLKHNRRGIRSEVLDFTLDPKISAGFLALKENLP